MAISNRLKRAGEIMMYIGLQLGRQLKAKSRHAPSKPPTRRLLPELPIEVWERVIDYLWAAISDLQACACVCRQWTPRSRMHLLARPWLTAPGQVARLAKSIRSNPQNAEAVKWVGIVGGLHKHDHQPIPHLGTFAAMLAGKLPSITRLYISDAKWQSGSMHPHVFLHLSSFHSITALHLHGVTFPTVRVFGRLVCALPSLLILSCQNVTFAMHGFDAGTFYKPQYTKIRDFFVDGDGMGEVVHCLVTSKIATTLEYISLNSERTNYQKPIHVRDVNTLGVQDLLQAAATSLHTLDVGLRDPKAARADVRRNTSMDLVHNIHLEYLILRMEVDKNARYTWIYSVLSSISSKKLEKIVIWIDIRQEHDKKILRRVMKVLSLSLCALLDGLLSPRTRFPSLSVVRFKLMASDVGVIPDGQEWSEHISSRFPMLYSKGLLSTAVLVTL